MYVDNMEVLTRMGKADLGLCTNLYPRRLKIYQYLNINMGTNNPNLLQ